MRGRRSSRFLIAIYVHRNGLICLGYDHVIPDVRVDRGFASHHAVARPHLEHEMAVLGLEQPHARLAGFPCR